MDTGNNQSLGREPLGAHLQRKRQESGLSLDELSKKTRIRKHYLKKIENGEFHLLPSPPYNRGFIRAYATYINTDPDAIVNQFNAEIGPED